jgi:hypothetical protein
MPTTVPHGSTNVQLGFLNRNFTVTLENMPNGIPFKSNFKAFRVTPNSRYFYCMFEVIVDGLLYTLAGQPDLAQYPNIDL